MHRVRLSVCIVLAIAIAHGLVPHSHPWDEAGHEHSMPPMAYAQTDPSCSVVPLGALPGQPAPI